MITSTGNCYKYYTKCYYTISTVVTKQSQIRVFTLLSPPDDHVSLSDHVPYKMLVELLSITISSCSNLTYTNPYLGCEVPNQECASALIELSTYSSLL